MRKSVKFFGAVAVAGLVASGASAYTAANTGVDAAYVGYQSAVISGVGVTNIAYNVDAADASKLSSIVFTETEDVSTGYKAVLSMTDGSAVETQFTCATPTWTAATTDPVVAAFGTITCTTSIVIADIASVGLTVAAL